MLKTSITWPNGYEVISNSITINEAERFQHKQCNSACTDTCQTKPIDGAMKYLDQSIRHLAKDPEEIKSFAINALKSLGYEDNNTCDKIKKLAEYMFSRFNTNHLKCRMDLVYTDSCRKFHVDTLYARSITTLLGPGTEFKLPKNSSEIFKVKTGETLLLKGLKHPGKNSKVVHRSPKISHLGVHRLVFVMDF